MSSLTTYCLLPTTYYLLPTTYLTPTTCYLLCYKAHTAAVVERPEFATLPPRSLVKWNMSNPKPKP